MPRKTNKIQSHTTILLVLEGQTEQLYFSEMRIVERIPGITIIPKMAQHSDLYHVLKNAKSENETGVYDSVWCIFDTDTLKTNNISSDVKLEKIDKHKSEIISNNQNRNKPIQEITKTNKTLNSNNNNNIIVNKSNNTGNIKYKPINKNQNIKKIEQQKLMNNLKGQDDDINNIFGISNNDEDIFKIEDKKKKTKIKTKVELNNLFNNENKMKGKKIEIKRNEELKLSILSLKNKYIQTNNSLKSPEEERKNIFIKESDNNNTKDNNANKKPIIPENGYISKIKNDKKVQINGNFYNYNLMKLHEEGKEIKVNEQESLFKNIYDSFSDNINSQKIFFDLNILDNDLEILDINYEESVKRKNEIISNDINLSSSLIIQDIKKNVKNEINEPLQNKNYFNLCKDYIVSDKNDGQINVENIYHSLLNDTEYQLYKNYFPVSYDTNFDLVKYNNLLSLIINNSETQEPISHIVALMIQYIFSNNINLQKADILSNEDIKNKIIEISLKSIRSKYSEDNSNLNIINNGILFSILNNENNNINKYDYDLLNNNNLNPIEFIIQLFNNNIMNKNEIVYFYFVLLNIKENYNNINFNINEEYEKIFNNFNICLYIILKFINASEIKNICKILVNSLHPKMTFCQYVILKIIIGEHDIIDEKFYAKIFTSFLNFVNIEKLLICDYYNLILFAINSEVKKIFAKCSILIKYKYSILKQKYEENQKENDLLLKEKLFENISQFGSISKNYFFMRYIQEEFCDNKKQSNIENENLLKDKDENSINQNEINSENNNDINNQINDNSSIENNGNGFFSSIKFALGFGINNTEENKSSTNYNTEEQIQINDDNNL